jgi:hypothetical protein
VIPPIAWFGVIHEVGLVRPIVATLLVLIAVGLFAGCSDPSCHPDPRFADGYYCGDPAKQSSPSPKQTWD